MKFFIFVLIVSFCKNALAHNENRKYRIPKKLSEICMNDAAPAISYYQKIFEHIVINNPEVFYQNAYYHWQEFCFKVDPADYFGGNADPKNKSIKFRQGTLNFAKNDAVVAAVMAHELAHILMQHQDSTILHPKLEDNLEFMILNEKRIELQKIVEDLKQQIRWLRSERYQLEVEYQRNPVPELAIQIENLNKRLKDLDAQFQLIDPDYQNVLSSYFKLYKKLLPPQEEMAWREQEADEVGFNLFLNAGFNPKAFKLAIEVGMDDHQKKECDLILAQVDIPGHTVPLRIRGSLSEHPENCWRIYNLTFLEAKIKHHDYYLDWMRYNFLEVLFPGELEGLKN